MPAPPDDLFREDLPDDDAPRVRAPRVRAGGDPLTEQDREHLRLLGVLHYVSAGLSVLGVLFMGLWLAVVAGIAGFATAPGGPAGPGGGAPPEAAFVFVFMGAVGVTALLVSVATVVAQALAGRNLHRMRGRTLIFVVAAVECLNFPLGTALGVFTFLVLNRPSVRAAFAENERAARR